MFLIKTSVFDFSNIRIENVDSCVFFIRTLIQLSLTGIIYISAMLAHEDRKEIQDRL